MTDSRTPNPNSRNRRHIVSLFIVSLMAAGGIFVASASGANAAIVCDDEECEIPCDYQDCEEELTDIVINTIKKKKELNIKALEDRFIPKKDSLLSGNVDQHTLSSYNDLIYQGVRL